MLIKGQQERRELGKIDYAEFGVVSDYPFLIGLQLGFAGKGWGVGDGGKYTVNLTEMAWRDVGIEACHKTVYERQKQIQELLKAAKVQSVSQLKGKPVEVTFEGNVFKDFRILEEVL